MDIKYSHTLDKVKYAIRDLIPYVKEVERRGKKVIYLNIGDPLKYDFKTPDHIIEAYVKASRKGYNYYSDSQGILELREAISKYERRINSIDVDPQYIVVTGGVAEAINFIIRAFTDPGDSILIPSPSYPSYIGAPYLYYGEAVEYKCVEEEGWRPDIEDLRKKINNKTRLLVIINPNNPTGAVYSRRAIKEIVDLACEYGIPIVSDEIYNQIIFNGKVYPPASLSKDALVIGLNGFSKAYLMTGWRLGYIYIRDSSGEYRDRILENIMKQARLRLCVNTPTQYAGIAALEGPQDHIKEMVSKLMRRSDLIYKRILEIDGICSTKPEGTFYIFPKIGDFKFSDDREFVIRLLREEGVFLVHGSGFGDLCGRGHFRAVFLPPLEVIDEAMDRIERFMRKMMKEG